MLFPEFFKLCIIRLLTCAKKKAVLVLEECFEIRMSRVYSIVAFDWPREVLLTLSQNIYINMPTTEKIIRVLKQLVKHPY
jgi:hypothetical protein